MDYLLSTERLGLRNWLDSDIKPLTEMNKDPEVMKYFPRTLTETETLKMLQRITAHFEKNGFGLFAVEDKNTKEFIGFTGFAIPTFEETFTPCVEIGWRYKKKAWGHGFATEAANACLQYGFEVLKLTKIVSFTSTHNVPSINVMKRTGMTYVADFDHPQIEEGSILKRHVLYEMSSIFS